MTNSKGADDKSPAVEEIFVNDAIEKQETDDNVSSFKEKLNTRTNKQDSKKLSCKSDAVKKTKNKPQVDVSTQRVTRNKSKTLNKSQCLTGSSKRYDKQKTSSADKEQIVSPNHSITEYFSCLDLKENCKKVDEKSDKTRDEINLGNENLASQSSHVVENTKKSLHCAITRKPDLGNHKLTEYFAIRRSDRKFKKEIDLEKQQDLEKKIINETEDGLEVKEFNEKGRGVITTRKFNKGDFVIEYIGDLIDRITAKKRETQYAKNKNLGCYMYYFKHKDQAYCIDATKESGKLGRLINHSRKGNLISRIVEVKQVPHLVLFAKTDIPVGTELLYDYGDRNQESIKNHPWLNL